MTLFHLFDQQANKPNISWLCSLNCVTKFGKIIPTQNQKGSFIKTALLLT